MHAVARIALFLSKNQYAVQQNLIVAMYKLVGQNTKYR